MNEKSVKKYAFIDALRGLAILGVILIHTSQWIPPQTYILSLIGSNGAQGVQLFFIASALTLFLSMSARQKKENSPTRNFFIRRFFRITPMYYLALVVFLLIDGLSKRYWAPNGLQWWDPVMTVFFLNGWHPELINSMVPGGWSIVVEMTFYLLVPFLFVRLKNVKSTLLFIGVTLLLGWGLNAWMTQVYTPVYPKDQQYLVSSFTFFWFFSQLPVFGIGILVYHLFQRYKTVTDRGLGFVLLLIFVFLAFAFLDTSTYQDLIPHHFLMAVAFAFLVFGMYFTNLRLLVNRATVWIGKISFSLYLVHFGMLRWLQAVFPHGFPLAGDFGMLAGYILLTVLAIIVSAVTYNLVERPGMDLGKYIIERLETAREYRRSAVNQSE